MNGGKISLRGQAYFGIVFDGLATEHDSAARPARHQLFVTNNHSVPNGDVVCAAILAIERIFALLESHYCAPMSTDAALIPPCIFLAPASTAARSVSLARWL